MTPTPKPPPVTSAAPAAARRAGQPQSPATDASAAAPEAPAGARADPLGVAAPGGLGPTVERAAAEVLAAPRFDLPSRPTGRGYRAARCSNCRAPLDGCFCAALRPIPCRTRVLVIMHALERSRPTNTGRFASQLLSGAELRVRGARDSRLTQVPLELTDLDPTDPNLLLLHPGPAAVPLDAQFRAAPGPLRLVVPDGTWTQTRQMLRREPRLKALRQVSLPAGKPSVYALRRGVHPGGLCTLEAIARALRALGEPVVAAELERVVLLCVRAGMAARGYHDWQPPI